MSPVNVQTREFWAAATASAKALGPADQKSVSTGQATTEGPVGFGEAFDVRCHWK